MFREIRRNDKQKSPGETEAILKECSYGILSVYGDDGYPYGVPVNYVFDDGKIIIHCAPVGHKLDAIKKEPKVSFTVVGADVLDKEKITTFYKSVICFGKARIAENIEEKRGAIEKVLGRFDCDGPEGMKYVNDVFDEFEIVIVDIEHMTGKGLVK